MSGMEGRLAAIRERIAAACSRAGRDSGEVELLAVSKTFPVDAIREAFDVGQRLFAESRQQEAASKIPALPEEIEWHFIGPLQRNKARKVLADFACVHSVDSLKLATHLDRISGEESRRTRVYLEVNIAGEPSKAGFTPEELLATVGQVGELPHLEPIGLMVIPPATDDEGEARHWFSEARKLRDRAETAGGLRLPGLSMGMSGDFEAAILEGATIVRVGSALFGERKYPV